MTDTPDPKLVEAVRKACGGGNSKMCDYPACRCSWLIEMHAEKLFLAGRALGLEQAAQWQPTHRHYKGGLYRKIGQGIHTETTEPLTFYDNEKGELFARPTTMFNGSLDGKGHQPRFRALAKETTDG